MLRLRFFFFSDPIFSSGRAGLNESRFPRRTAVARYDRFGDRSIDRSLARSLEMTKRQRRRRRLDRESPWQFFRLAGELARAPIVTARLFVIRDKESRRSVCTTLC